MNRLLDSFKVRVIYVIMAIPAILECIIPVTHRLFRLDVQDGNHGGRLIVPAADWSWTLCALHAACKRKVVLVERSLKEVGSIYTQMFFFMNINCKFSVT